MSINLGKLDGPKTLNVDTFNENNGGFHISHSDDFLSKEPVQQRENLGLDFLTQNEKYNDQYEENGDNDEQSSDPMMNEPYNDNNEYNQEDQEYSEEEIKQRKAFALYNLERYRKQGYELSRSFGINHSLSELETELTRIETEKNLDNGLQACKDTLLLATNAIETINTRYGPEWIKLNGWSKFIMEEYKTHKYDDCLIKLWQKYSSKLPDSPEFTLIWLLGLSAFTFHMSRIAAEAHMAKQQVHEFRQQEMREPTMNFEDFDVSESDTNSVISGSSRASVYSNSSNRETNEVDDIINISIPDKKPAKKRGRPSKKSKEL